MSTTLAVLAVAAAVLFFWYLVDRFLSPPRE